MGESYWTPPTWHPSTRRRIPHKCDKCNHWFWKGGVYRIENSYDGGPRIYRCESCHALATLGGEYQREKRTPTGGDLMAKESLTIWVHTPWLDRPEVKKLQEDGHTVEDILFHEPDAPHGDADPPDLILHPNAWRWTDDLFPHLEVTIKEARRAKYGDARKQARVEAKARKDAAGGKRSKRPKAG